MDQVDRQMEKRVWDRVRQREPGANMPQLQQDSLKPWILAAQENASAYRNLALQLIGKPWEGLRRLEQESSRSVWCLQGISALRGEGSKLTPLPVPRENPRRTLEKCYHRSRRLWEEMELRASDPEYGPVFRKLARQTEDHCAAVAELIGKLE